MHCIVLDATGLHMPGAGAAWWVSAHVCVPVITCISVSLAMALMRWCLSMQMAVHLSCVLPALSTYQQQCGMQQTNLITLGVFAVQPSSNFGIGSDNGQTGQRVSEDIKHPHLDKVLHPFQHRSG